MTRRISLQCIIYNVFPDLKFQHLLKITSNSTWIQKRQFEFLIWPYNENLHSKNKEKSCKIIDILLTAPALSGKLVLSFSFGSTIPNVIVISLFGSEIIGMGKSAAARLLYACMSLIQLWCESMESQDRAMHLMLRLAKSGTSDANTPSSVVHTGEKSAGYEIRMPHL